MSQSKTCHQSECIDLFIYLETTNYIKKREISVFFIIGLYMITTVHKKKMKDDE